jgi:hypothetical protein
MPHVNEYNPNSSNAVYGVQTDPQKLKFNNVKSCIAVGIVPRGGNQLIGVHFTVLSTQNDSEMDGALTKVRSLLGGSKADVFLVAAWSHHATTNLLKKLKKFASTVSLCDVAPNSASEADVDVKMEMNSSGILISVREHALIIKGTDGNRIPKAKYATPGSFTKTDGAAGKTMFQTDRDSKPWMRVQPAQIYPS